MRRVFGFAKALALSALAFSVVACGGGGGSDTDPGPFTGVYKGSFGDEQIEMALIDLGSLSQTSKGRGINGDYAVGGVVAIKESDGDIRIGRIVEGEGNEDEILFFAQMEQGFDLGFDLDIIRNGNGEIIRVEGSYDPIIRSAGVSPAGDGGNFEVSAERTGNNTVPGDIEAFFAGFSRRTGSSGEQDLTIDIQEEDDNYLTGSIDSQDFTDGLTVDFSAVYIGGNVYAVLETGVFVLNLDGDVTTVNGGLRRIIGSFEGTEEGDDISGTFQVTESAPQN